MQPLLADPRQGLLEADLLEVLSLRRGARVRHGVDVLDTTDVPTGEALRFVSGSVGWSYRATDPSGANGMQQVETAAVRRQATLELAGPVAVNLSSRRLRLWTELQLLTGAWARFYLGVFSCPRPAVSDDGVVLTRTLNLADKTHRWNEATLTEPLFVPASTAVVAYVKADLTTRFGETRFAITGSDQLLGGPGTVFESGTSLLQVYSALLQAIGYDQLTADETGAARSGPLADLANRGPEVTYGAGQAKVKTAGSVTPLLPTLPNVVRFSARQAPGSGSSLGNGLTERVNQSTGPGSLDARGGERVELRVEVDATDQPTLEAIADAEKQRYFAGGGETWTGTVGLNPRHSDRDVIALDLPRLGLDPDDAWLVTSWTYPLSPMTEEGGALMPITAERRVTL